MKQKTCSLLLPLVILLLLVQKSVSMMNPDYVACKPLECGRLSISYPFYVPQKQPSWCGSQSFEVSCNPQNQTIINLSGDNYIINHINYQDLSVNITNSAFSGSVFDCLTSVHSLNFSPDSKFKFTSRYYKPKELLLLLQNCSRNISSNKNYTKIKCKLEGDEHYDLFAVYKENFHPEEVGKCNETVVMPYDEEQHGVIGFEGLLKKGVVLEYTANNCSVCQQSGGSCGFSKTQEFFCFCPDRNHKVHCHQRSKEKHLGIMLGAVLPGSALILVFIVYCLCRKLRKNKSGSSNLPSRSISFNHRRLDLEVGSMNGVTVFSYTELEEATNNFDPSRQLGEGGFGVVYHGKLRDGREVAVKRLYKKSFKRIEQFKNEIKILTDLRHQNLVTLYGCTSRHTRELLLVYEYIPNRTVADHLHGELGESQLLPWSTRMSIAIQTATALTFLHFKDIIHRDVKTNNILLDNSFTVKVADFGLSRLFPPDVTHVSTAPQGTPGYVDPEYYQCYQLTDKSDVFSFGVLLIELISSLPAVDVGRQRHEINLSNYAMNRILSSSLIELVDPKLGFETDFKVRRMITLVAELASQCLQHDRELRPSMEQVMEDLKRIASLEYDAIEAEETEWSTRTTHFMKPPPAPTNNDDVDLLRNSHLQPPSPVSVMDKWLNTSKSTTPNTSRSN